MKKVLSKAVPIVLICIFFVMLIIASNKKGDNHIIEEESFYVQVPEAQRFFSTDSSFSLLPSHNEKYKVIYVFASWCPSCSKHIGLIQEVQREYEMSVIGLSWDENQENLKEWLAKNSNPFEEIGALSSDLVMELGVSVLPVVFIIDQTSKIVYHDEGDIDETQFKTYWIKSMPYINRSYSDFLKQACVLQDIYNLDEMPRDCSTRQYTRIIEQRSDKTYVLMDSSLEIDSCVSFSKVGRFLIENQFKVPKIYHECHNSGLMLLEDFGNLTVSQALERDNSIESLIYINATNNLIQLAKSACSLDLPHCDSNILNKELQVFLDWTLKFIIPEEGKFKSASNDFLGIFTSLYKIIEDMPRIMMLRDYHADNLMLLPTQKQAECQIGILDFQDALLGSHCYDLVSLLEDARRDVSPEVVNVTKEHYFDHFKDEVPKEKLEAAYTILGAQRNLKIIGIFRRLYIKYGKGHRLSSLPRVTRYIFDSLNSPQLFELKNWFEEYITQGKDQDSHIFLRDCV